MAGPKKDTNKSSKASSSPARDVPSARRKIGPAAGRSGLLGSTSDPQGSNGISQMSAKAKPKKTARLKEGPAKPPKVGPQNMRALLAEEAGTRLQGAAPSAVAVVPAVSNAVSQDKAPIGKDSSEGSSASKKRKRASSSESVEDQSSSAARKTKSPSGKKLSKKERKKAKKEKKAEKKKEKKLAKEKERDKKKNKKESEKLPLNDISAVETQPVAADTAVAATGEAAAEAKGFDAGWDAVAADALAAETDEDKEAKKLRKAEKKRKKKEKKLKKQEEEEVDSRDEAEEFLVWDRLILTRRDFVSLAPGGMLNDSMMDFALRLIHRCLAPRADVYLFSSLFFTRLMAAGANDGNQGWENVKGWTKNVAVFTYEYLLFPINSITISKVRHWWLAVVKLRGPDGQFAPSVTWFDTNPDFDHTEVYSVALRFLRGYLRREWVERPASRRPSEAERGFDAGRLSRGATQRVPHQENAVDCGVFLLENVLRLLSGADRWLATVSSRGDEAQESLWCDQAQATQRRDDLQKSLNKLVVAAAGAAATLGGRPSVADALDSEPELSKFLLDTCTLPADWLRALETGGCCSSQPRAAEAPAEELTPQVEASLNGIWVHANSGELAGEIEGGKLNSPNGDVHSITLRSPVKLCVVMDGEERLANVSQERLVWLNGAIWKRFKEDDAATASSDDSDVAAKSTGHAVPVHGVGSVADMAAWASA